MLIYSLLYFLFFSMSYTLVFSWSLVYDWHVHIPVCRKYNIVYFFTVSVQIIYIYFILVLEDKTDYYIKKYFIYLCSIIFLCSCMYFMEKYHL